MARSRLRWGSAVMSPGTPPAIAPSGRWNSGVEMAVSISLLGRTAGVGLPGASVNAGPKSKNVCQPMKRRRARAPPRRSTGSASPSPEGSKTIPKKGEASSSPPRLAR